MKKQPKLPPDQAVAKIFARQHGAASDKQVRAAGFTWEKQQRMIARKLWHRKGPGVITLVGSADTWHQRAMIATLYGTGKNVISGPSAARLHKLDGFAHIDTIEVVIPFGGHDNTPEEVDVRWSRRLTNADRYTVDGIPLTTIPVTIIHLHASGLESAKALDSALRMGKPALWFKQTFERWQTKDPRDPAAAVLQMLNDRAGKRLPRSWFQRLAGQAFDRDGITLVDEWPVHDENGKLVAELDLALVDLKVGVECQSVQFHTITTDRIRDTDRRRLLRQMGWEIVDVWWSDLERMDAVLADLRLAIDKARRLLV